MREVLIFLRFSFYHFILCFLFYLVFFSFFSSCTPQLKLFLLLLRFHLHSPYAVQFLMVLSASQFDFSSTFPLEFPLPHSRSPLLPLHSACFFCVLLMPLAKTIWIFACCHTHPNTVTNPHTHTHTPGCCVCLGSYLFFSFLFFFQCFFSHFWIVHFICTEIIKDINVWRKNENNLLFFLLPLLFHLKMPAHLPPPLRSLPNRHLTFACVVWSFSGSLAYTWEPFSSLSLSHCRPSIRLVIHEPTHDMLPSLSPPFS